MTTKITHKAFGRISEQITALQSNPDHLANKLCAVSAEMGEAAPELACYLINHNSSEGFQQINVINPF